jgi:hypothetical protein
MEKNNRKFEERDYTEHENVVLEKVRNLWEIFSNDLEAFEECTDRLNALKDELKAKGENARHYLLFHKLIGSSDMPESFDTKDHDIEKFVDKVSEEYKQ